MEVGREGEGERERKGGEEGESVLSIILALV